MKIFSFIVTKVINVTNFKTMKIFDSAIDYYYSFIYYYSRSDIWRIMNLFGTILNDC